MQILISGARVMDPGRWDGPMDVVVDKGRIHKVQPPGTVSDLGDDCRVIHAAGKVLVPGLIDMHVHLREPGQEYKETIATGCMAAAAGGFTAVCAMPNTNPVNDNSQITRFILEKALQAGTARVHPVAAITRGLGGEALCEFGSLKKAGAVAFSDDGRPVADSQMMRRALEYAKGFGMPIIAHCEDPGLFDGGVMNEGAVATRLGLAGIPNAAETVMVLRDIALSKLTGAALHIAHVSAAESVEALRAAKADGIPVTAETAPHYFTLTEEAVAAYDTHAKMNPPLRTHADRAAVRRGLADGTIDAIATDHAPHSVMEKEVEFDIAANGIVGLETALALCLRLVDDGVLSLKDLVEKMSTHPARILGLHSGIVIGGPADLTLIDTQATWTVVSEQFRSLGRNTPFEGWRMKGRAVLTVVDGRIVYDDTPAR